MPRIICNALGSVWASTTHTECWHLHAWRSQTYVQLATKSPAPQHSSNGHVKDRVVAWLHWNINEAPLMKWRSLSHIAEVTGLIRGEQVQCMRTSYWPLSGQLRNNIDIDATGWWNCIGGCKVSLVTADRQRLASTCRTWTAFMAWGQVLKPLLIRAGILSEQVS